MHGFCRDGDIDMTYLSMQCGVADETREFLHCWGLKSKYVAAKVGIDEQSFSKFLNHKLALSDNQMKRLNAYMVDYKRRNT